MATSIPPHNAAELCDAAIHLIENRTISDRDLMRFVFHGRRILGIRVIWKFYGVGLVARGRRVHYGQQKLIQACVEMVRSRLESSVAWGAA
jgi:hypothetical protein